MSFEKRLSSVKIKALNNAKYTFITSILVNLQTKVDFDDDKVAYTDGDTITFCKGAENLPNDQLLGLMFHELMHIVLRHNDLVKHYSDPKKFNLAADFYIDMDLIDSLDVKMPQWGGVTHGSNGGHYDPQYSGLSIKEIYDLLPDSEEDESMGDISGQGEAIDEIQADDLIAAAEIASNNKGASTGSSALDRMIKELREPTVPWEQLLEEFVTEACREGRSYRRLNRRYDDFFLPTPTGRELGKIALSFDLSCSVTDEELSEYIGNVNYILNTVQPKSTEVVGWSTQVDSVTEYQQGDELDISGFTSGGGTNPQPMLDHFEDTDAELLIIFTDGEFWGKPDTSKVGTTIIWVIVNNTTFSYGEDDPVIYIEVKD